MEIQFEQTKADVAAFNRHIYLRRRISWIIIGLYPAAAIYLFRRSEPGQVFVIALLTLIGTAALIFGLQMIITKVRLSSRKYQAFFGPRTYRLDDTGIEAETTDSTSKMNWKMIQKVAVTDRHLFLHLTPLNALIVPKRAFATEEAFREATAEIQRQVSQAG